MLRGTALGMTTGRKCKKGLSVSSNYVLEWCVKLWFQVKTRLGSIRICSTPAFGFGVHAFGSCAWIEEERWLEREKLVSLSSLTRML